MTAHHSKDRYGAGQGKYIGIVCLSRCMRFILGKKLGMTRVFDAKGTMVGVTLVQAGPVYVARIKDAARDADAYNAVQYGFGEKKRASKAERGSAKASGREKAPRVLREVRMREPIDATQGDVVDVSIFKPGDVVMVSGLSKGKGFQGAVKRHGFKGGPASHGQKHSAREVGSIGSSGRQRVLKGTRMAGRMGHHRVTISGLTIERVDPAHQLLAIRGAVPGIKGSILEIKAK